MYSVELNIGSWSSPSVGGGWVAASPVINKTTISKELEGEQIFARIKMDGNLQFNYGEFTVLDTLRTSYAKIDLRVRHTSNGGTTTTIFEGELDLEGGYKENNTTLSVSPNDEYTSLDTNESEKLNTLNAGTPTKCDVIQEEDRLSFYDTAVAQSTLFWGSWTKKVV